MPYTLNKPNHIRSESDQIKVHQPVSYLMQIDSDDNSVSAWPTGPRPVVPPAARGESPDPKDVRRRQL